MKATPLLLTASLSANLVAGWLLWKNQNQPAAIGTLPQVAFQVPDWPAPHPFPSVLLDIDPAPALKSFLDPHRMDLPVGPIRIDFGEPTQEDSFNDRIEPRIDPNQPIPLQNPPRPPLPLKDQHPRDSDSMRRESLRHSAPEPV